MKTKALLLSLGAMLSSEAVYAAAQSESSSFVTRKHLRDEENEHKNVKIQRTLGENIPAGDNPKDLYDLAFAQSAYDVEVSYNLFRRAAILAKIQGDSVYEACLSGLYRSLMNIIDQLKLDKSIDIIDIIKCPSFEDFRTLESVPDYKTLVEDFKCNTNIQKAYIRKHWETIMPEADDEDGEIAWSAKGVKLGDADALKNLENIVSNDSYEHVRHIAQYKLGKLYYKGVGVEQDITKAIELMCLASRDGHSDAFEFILSHVEDVEKIAESGNPNILYILACACSEESDEKKSYSYSRRAAIIAKEKNDAGLYRLCVDVQYKAFMRIVKKFERQQGKKTPKLLSYDRFRILQTTPNYDDLVEDIKNCLS